MDMKKKLESAYIPEGQGRKEKVVLGLSGGVDSWVSAYLLKIQKYELIAVTVVNNWEEESGGQLSCRIDSSRLQEIKDFCHKLGIPHHVIKAEPQFREFVLKPWMADKVMGKHPNPCWNCQEMRLVALYEKMLELGAKQLATGHFAKLFSSQNSLYVHTSSDEDNDQSAVLSRLPREILSHLILPLSDLSKKEVLKLAENFGVSDRVKELAFNECLKGDQSQLIEKEMPARFLTEGEIEGPEANIDFGSHEGVHRFTYGGELDARNPKLKMGGYFYPSKKIIALDESFFVKKELMLLECRFSEEVSWLEPLSGFVHFRDKYYECLVTPKNLSAVAIHLEEAHSFLEGQFVSVLKKKGKNAKIFLTGKIHFVEEDPVIEEGEPSVPKINHSIDF